MATSIIKTGVDNYFINEDGSISMQYDPSFNKCFILGNGDSSKEIPLDTISIQKGGQIAFKYDNIKYIIDDGYRDRLVMAGYLDIDLKDDRPELSASIKSTIFNSLKGLKFDNLTVVKNTLQIINHSKTGYDMRVEIEPLDKMISRNIKRAELKLPMYPTRQGFNRFRTLYFRVYAKKRVDAKKIISPEELHFMGSNMIKAIATSKNLSFRRLDDILPDCTHKNYFNITEMKIEKVILKWEDDL